jgi:tight adherence protein B
VIFAVLCLLAVIAFLVDDAGTRASPGRKLLGVLDRWAGATADGLVAAFTSKRREDPVGVLCAAMSGELRAGAAPGSALLAATAGNAVVPRARAAALLGEPVAPALLADSRAAGSAGLAGIAACWAASAETGAGLADGLDRVAELARTERRIIADLAAETAAPRATARILSLLPVFGILFGEMLGAQPLAWLFGSRPGWVCLLLGAAFLAAGHLWAARIVRQASPSTIPAH